MGGGDLGVTSKKREEGEGGENRGARNPARKSDTTGADHEPRKPQQEQYRKVEEVVPVAQSLQRPGGPEEGQPSGEPRAKKRVKAEQRKRHPIGREDLQVGEVRGAIGPEA